MALSNLDLTFEQHIVELENTVAGFTDPEWQLHYSTTRSRRILELLATLANYYQFQTNSARKESYLFEASARTSVVASAESMGYAVARGTSHIVDIEVTTAIPVVIKNFQVVGTFDGLNVYYIGNLVTINGTAIIRCTVGNITYAGNVITSPSGETPKFRPIRFIGAPPISETLRVLKQVPVGQVGTVEVDSGQILPTTLGLSGVLSCDVQPHSSLLSDISVLGKYVVLTNPNSGVDLLTNNSDGTVYSTGDVFIIESIEAVEYNDTDAVLVPSYTMVAPFSISSISLVSSYQQPENIDSIRVNSSISNDVSSLVRSRSDVGNNIRDLITNVRDIDQSTDPLTLVETVYYVKQDETSATAIEIDNILVEYNSRRSMGVPVLLSSSIKQGIPIQLQLDLTVLLNVNTSTLGLDIQQDILDKVYYMMLKFNSNVDTDPRVQAILSADIESLSYVSTVTSMVFTLDGTVIDPNERYYFNLDKANIVATFL